MNPIQFPCSHCSETITVPPDVQWRALPCPHCKQVTLVPVGVAGQGTPTLALRVPIVRLSGAPGSTIGVPRDLGPDFTETLRKAREATDSIFNDEDEDSDSLFGSQVTPRKLVIPPHAQSLTPPSIPDPSQATLRIPGLPELPPIRPGSPTPATATVKPLPVKQNPFGDFTAESSPNNSGDFQLVDAKEPVLFPWKNSLVAVLSAYAVLMTAVAIWGWFRTTTTTPAKPSITTPSVKRL